MTTKTKPGSGKAGPVSVLLPLSGIKPDPGQPRKTYDDVAFEELMASIIAHGVMQPIAVRKNGKEGEYVIIYGERRWRAALQVAEKTGIDTIPCTVWEGINDENVLEMQLTENLMRENVHPMEEAIAFVKLLETKSSDEVAATIGKSPRFVRDRTRLANLTKKWQDIFSADLINIVTALKIAALPEKAQNELYKKEDAGNHLKDGSKISVSEFELKQCFGDLSDARWDMTRVFGEMGSCSTCMYNSGNALLFESENDKKVCSNIRCFMGKHDIVAKETIEQAKNNPEVVFISTGYDGRKEAEQMEKKHKVDKVYSMGEFQLAYEPEKPTWDEYLKENYQKGYNTKAEVKEEFSQAVKEYEEDKEKYEEQMAAGLITKAVVLSENHFGKEVNILIGKGKSGQTQKGIKEKLAEGTVSAEDIATEIQRIRDKEKRNKELDINKVHHTILGDLELAKKDLMSAKWQGIDRGIMIKLLINAAGYKAAAKIAEAVKMPGHSRMKGYDENYYKGLAKMSDNDLAKIVRIIALDSHGTLNNRDVGDNDTMILFMAGYAGVDIKKIREQQDAIATERAKKAEKRISELSGKKKELIKKPAKKKKK